MAKIVSRLTKIEQEMPEEVWKKIAAGTPDSALKSWASREAYFNDKYQDYLKAQPKPGTPVEKPAIQTTQRIIKDAQGNVVPTKPPPGGSPIQKATGAAATTTKRTVTKMSGPPPGGNKTTLRGRKPKPKINKGKRQTA